MALEMERDILEKIARFRLKPDSDLSKIQTSPYASFIAKDATKSCFYPLVDSITVNIGFPEDLSKWNDFDYILVLDEDFGQPYSPFYHYLNEELKEPFPFLEKVIQKYNKTLRHLLYLEEIDNEQD